MKKTIFLLAALLPITVFAQGGFRRGFLVLPDTSTNNVQTKAEVSAQIAAEVSSGGVGDITSVVAGTGLTGGATSGAATVDLNPKLLGRTITVTSDSVHVTAASLDSSHIKTAGVDDGAIRNQAVGPNQLANTAVTAAAYTLPSVTFDADGRATAAASVTTLTGIDAVVTDLDLTSAASGNVIMRRASGVWVDTTLSASYDSSTAVGDAGWTATSTTTSLVSGVVEARVGGTSKRQVWYDGDGDTLRIRTQPSGTSQWFQWKQGTTVKAAIDTNGNFSSPDASGGSGSEKFGASVTHSGGDRNTVVGANSSLTNSSSSDNVSVGQNIDITGAGSDDNVFIGSEHQATGTVSRVINIGYANTIPSGVNGTVILGNTVHNQGTIGSNECWIGGANQMNNMWLGAGKSQSGSAVNVAINVTNSASTNIAGGTLTLKSGLATGTAASGNINLQVGDPIASGSTVQTAYNRVTVTNVGAASAAPTDSTFNSQGGHFSQGLLVGGTITAGSGAVAITNSTGNLDGTKVANADLGDVSVSSGAWSIDASAVTTTKVSTALKTEAKSFTLADTSVIISTDDNFGLWKVPTAITITEIAGFTNVGTVTFNVEQRAETTPNTSGTDVLSADLVADNDQQESTSFNDATVPADTWLYFSPSAAASSPKKLTVSIKYTID